MKFPFLEGRLKSKLLKFSFGPFDSSKQAEGFIRGSPGMVICQDADSSYWIVETYTRKYPLSFIRPLMKLISTYDPFYRKEHVNLRITFVEEPLDTVKKLCPNLFLNSAVKIEIDDDENSTIIELPLRQCDCAEVSRRLVSDI